MLSVAIIARDEERHIGGAIASVASLAAEVIVLLDDRTCDRSAAIGRAHGARVLAEPWRGFPAQRNRALDVCLGDWVLFLDADERVTPELYVELQTITANSDKVTASDNRRPTTPSPRLRAGDDRRPTIGTRVPVYPFTRSPAHPLTRSPVQVAGYWIPRYNQFFGKTLRGGGWYPDHQLRLLRRGRARYDQARLVHELVNLDGYAGYLDGHLLHLNIERLDEFWSKQTAYALQEAQTLALGGRHARWRNFAGAPLREFARRYLTLGGYRDGALGLFLCGALAYFEWVKYVHLKGLERLE